MTPSQLASLARTTILLTLATLGMAAALPASAADDAALKTLGKQLFSQQCAVCHTLKDAAAEGAIGPVLDELKPDAAGVVKALRDGLGSMPSFKGLLSEDQIAALARYVSTASGAEK